MSSITGQPRNRRNIRVSQQSKMKLRWPEHRIEHQNVHRRHSSSSRSASIYIRVYTSEHTRVYKRGRFPKTRDLWRKSASMGYRMGCVHCPSPRGGRGRRAAVDIFRGVFFSVWWDFVRFFSFSSLLTHPAYCKYETSLPHVPFY